jgi:hypothetical protein
LGSTDHVSGAVQTHRPRTVGRSQLDLDASIPNASGKALNGLGNGFGSRFAGADVYQTLMQRTFHATIFNITFRESRSAMAASINQSENCAAQFEERELFSAGIDRQSAIFSDVAFGCDIDPFRHNRPQIG